MKSFYRSVIEEVVDSIYLEKTIFVIPNRRSRLIIKKEILNTISKTSISPIILSVDDFIEKIADLKESTMTSQMFLLYESYIKASGLKELNSYSSFRSWSKTLLNDLNDIDMSLCDNTIIFKDLFEIHKIQSINEPNNEKLNFWGMLPKIVKIFKEKLKKENSATKGTCHLYAKENVEIFSKAHSDFSFIFIGLNSLSASEQFIINYLLKNNDTRIFWDCDKSFIENSEHEAGYFFRKYMYEWDYYKNNKFKYLNNDFSSQKNISIYETSKQIAQIKTCSDIVEGIKKNNSKSRTAIILPDTNLLIPLINSLNIDLDDISVSISNPVKQMSLSKFVINFFEMYNRVNYKKFYYKDVINIFSSYFFKKSIKNHSSIANKLRDEIIKGNMIYVSYDFISEKTESDVILDLFKCTESNIIDAIHNAIDLFDENILDQSYIEVSNKIKSTISIIKNFNSKYKLSTNFKSLSEFFIDSISNQSLNFYQNKESSFYIMGLLESRGFEFDNVIVCSLNEGVLPSNNFYNSLLPFDLKKKFNLPTIVDDDARTSYDFYHLLQRASDIHLIYNSVSEGLDSGEKSRYIYQLELQKNKNHIINEIISHYPYNISDDYKENFEKTKEVMSRLHEISESGFSPSSLNRYIENPINFFDEHVLEVRKNEEVKESPEARGIGNIFHNVMENIYKPFIGKKLDLKTLKTKISSIEKYLNDEFISEYGKNYERGKNLIIYAVLKKAITQLLEIDIKKIKKGIHIEIVDVEAKLDVDLTTSKSKIKYKLKGTVDRIQRENTQIKIIDYKTGNLELSNLSFKDYKEIIQKNKKEAFQLLSYCLMFNKTHKPEKLVAGIISFKKINQGFLPIKKSKNFYYELSEINNFKMVLDELIEEIFNPKIDFTPRQTT